MIKISFSIFKFFFIIFINSINNNKDRPYFIIDIGPTASGKGSIPGKLIEKFNLDTNYSSILIDDLVESNPYYKKTISDYLEKQ